MASQTQSHLVDQMQTQQELQAGLHNLKDQLAEGQTQVASFFSTVTSQLDALYGLHEALVGDFADLSATVHAIMLVIACWVTTAFSKRLMSARLTCMCIIAAGLFSEKYVLMLAGIQALFWFRSLVLLCLVCSLLNYWTKFEDMETRNNKLLTKVVDECVL